MMDTSSKKNLNIHLIPDVLFQPYLLDTVEGMTSAETNSYVSLHLEENSPFPLDQLYWGFIKSEKKILAYAAYQNALLNAGDSYLDSADYLLPNFIGHLGRALSKVTTIKTLENDWNISLHFLPGEALPEAINYTPKVSQEQIPEEHVEVEEVSSIDLLDKGIFQCSVIKPMDGKQNEKLTFPSILTSKNIWDADIRPVDIKKSLQKYKRKERILHKATQGIIAGAAICLVASCVIFGSSQLNKSRHQKIQLQEPIVQEIKANDSLADKLTAFSTKQMRPFAMLHIVNTARPQETSFNQVSCDSWNRLLIEGRSLNGTQFNQFLRNLNEKKYVEKAQVIKQRTTQGSTLFTLDVLLKEIPIYEQLDPTVKELKEDTTNEH